MLEDVFPCKTMLTVNAIPVKATRHSPGAHGILVHVHVHIKSIDNCHGNVGALCCYGTSLLLNCI